MFKKKRPFKKDILNDLITPDDELEKKMNSKNEINWFNYLTWTKAKEKKQWVIDNENMNKLLQRREKVLNYFKNKKFPIKSQSKKAWITTLTPKWMLLWLPIKNAL